MGAKNSSDARKAQQGAAQDHPTEDAPGKNQPPVKECKNKHWIAVRVEFEDAQLVETGVLMRLKLNNGETRDITLDVEKQPGGKYHTTRILDLTEVCEVSFPDMYDKECKSK